MGQQERFQENLGQDEYGRDRVHTRKYNINICLERLMKSIAACKLFTFQNVVNDEHVPSQLPESVQRLVKVMIKHRRRDFPKILGQQWPEIQGPELPEIQTRDSRKWPIGILNKKHIEEAFDILGQLINCVTERERDTIEETRVIRLTNKYYSLVPRGLKSDYLRLLDTAEAIQVIPCYS